MMDPLRDYYDALRDAPVPARLMAETPPETFVRKLLHNLSWVAAGLTLCLALATLPTPVDGVAAERQARAISLRVALRAEAER